jgi:ATP/ADP translocase
MIRRFISSFLDVRKGEALLTFLMFSYYYLILVTYYLLKPARDSLFLVKLGPTQLPWVFILTALIIAPITTVYARASRSLQLTRLIYVTSAILIVNLVVLRWLLDMEMPWVFYVFYIWVSIYGALTASQYWLFANAVYDPAQGKRLFALLNLGGILGAMTGGEVTRFFIKNLGVSTEDLLFFCVAFVAAFTVLVSLVWRVVLKDRREGRAPKKSAAKGEEKEKLTELFSMIKRSRHLMYLVGIIALTMATASFVDFQFKTVSVGAYPEKEDLTSFLGLFYGRLSLVSLVLQVVFAYKILRVLGVTGIVMFLPLGLLFGSVAMFIFPGLIAAVVLRGADGAFKYSLDKTGRELMFLPIPLEVKKRTKVFIDMFVDRWFRGVAGAALLLFTVVLGLSVRQLSIVVVIMLAVWITLVVLIRKEYVHAFRIALEKREIDPSQLTVNITDAATVRTLREALHSRNEREIVYALDLLATAGDKSLLEELESLLSHRSSEVRAKALHLMSTVGSDSHVALAEPLIRDDDPQVRLEALRFMAGRADHDPLDVFRKSAESEPQVAATALRYIGGHGTMEQRRAVGVDAGAVSGLIERSRGAADGEAIRVETARAIGDLGEAAAVLDVHGVLHELLDDPSDRVVAAALLSMGKTRDREHVTTLVESIRDRRRRKHARDGLVAYGDGVVGTLSDILGDDRADIVIRRYLPVVLSRIPTQKSVDALSGNLTVADTSVRFRIVKALNTLRRRYPDLEIKEEAVDDAFVEETRIYYEILQISSLHGKGVESEADALLKRALDERLTLNLERIFRLLGLSYPPNDIYSAYLGIVGAEKNRHASAFEFLDNVVGKNVKKYLFPIIDRISETVSIERGQELFGFEIKSKEEALLHVMRGPDAWLKACALHCVTADDTEEVKRAAAGAVRDPDPLVVETAKLALERIA